MTAVFAASAVAGDGQGHDGQGGGGQSSQSSQQSSGGHDQSSQQKSSDQQSASSTRKQSDQKPTLRIQVVTSATADEPGTKPSNNTFKNTSTKVGDKPDVSKRYGNGKTAAEIAKSHGAPDGTVLTGPGNSQPHKVVTCKHSHAVDVHAVKSYSTQDCNAAKVEVLKAPEQKNAEQKSTEQNSTETPKPEASKSLRSDHKVTLCHLTGNGTFVAITVDKHALEEGHTAAKGDIIPMPAGGCGAVAPLQATLDTPCVSGQVKGDDDNETSDTGVHQDSKGSHESKGNDDDADEATTTCMTEANGTAGASVQILAPATQAAAAPVTQSSVQAAGQVAGTQAVQQQTTATVTVTPTPASVSASNATQGTPPTAAAAPQGGVLGATATLNTPKRGTGGVLGAAGNIAGASLPFTGFPVWLALLVALALVAVGLVLRRSGGTATRL